MSWFHPVTEEILATCPKFRILVVGKSGAGKSSLINAAFGVNLANVSHEQSGVANIYDDITSDQNSRFILHDSQGFVAGETQNLETVVRFITERVKQPELKDRLHAIW
jgi:predicted GTPase